MLLVTKILAVGKKERSRWLQHGRIPGEARIYPGAAGALQKESRGLLGWTKAAVPPLLFRVGSGFVGHPLQRVRPKQDSCSYSEGGDMGRVRASDRAMRRSKYFVPAVPPPNVRNAPSRCIRFSPQVYLCCKTLILGDELMPSGRLVLGMGCGISWLVRSFIVG